MKKEDTKKQIRSLWLQYPETERKQSRVFQFIDLLKNSHPELLTALNIPSGSDKRQVIRGIIADLIERP